MELWAISSLQFAPTMSLFVIDVRAHRQQQREGVCTVVSVDPSGALVRRDKRVTRVCYVRGSSIGEVQKAARLQLSCGVKCTAMARDAGWFAVRYDFAHPALATTDFDDVVEQTNNARIALWLNSNIGAAIPNGMPALRCVAVAVCGLRASLLLVGADEAPITVECSRDDELNETVARELRRLRAHVVVSRTHFWVDCAYIDIVKALHWCSQLPAKAVSAYALCRAAGVEQLLPVVMRDERAAEVEARAIEHLFVTHSLLSVALVLSQRTGVALGRVFSAPRSELIESMLLTQALEHGYVPLVHAVAPPVSSDGNRGGLCAVPVCGAHDNGPFVLLDFAATYPSLIIEHSLCWHDPPLLPELMQALLLARRDAADAGHKQAVKLLANSVAGCLYASSGGRFSAAAVGERVADHGRALFSRAEQAAGELGLAVLYGVTDSLLVRCSAIDGEAAIERLIERASSSRVTLRVQERFDKVVIFNCKDMLAVVGNEVRRCPGLQSWSQSEWLRRHVPLAIKAVRFDGDAIDAVVDEALAELSNEADWCVRELAYFAAGDNEQTEPLIGNNVRARDFCAGDTRALDSVRAWYREQLYHQVSLRVAEQQVPRAATTSRVRFGPVSLVASTTAMPEPTKVIDIEDLALSTPPLPLCVRSAVAARYEPGRHEEQQLFAYLALRSLGLSQADTQAHMLHDTPSDKRVERGKKLSGFERAADKKWQQSRDGLLDHGTDDEIASAKASCFNNCKTLASKNRCPFVAANREQALREAGASETVIAQLANNAPHAEQACGEELIITFRAQAASIKHISHYVAAAQTARKQERAGQAQTQLEPILKVFTSVYSRIKYVKSNSGRIFQCSRAAAHAAAMRSQSTVRPSMVQTAYGTRRWYYSRYAYPRDTLHTHFSLSTLSGVGTTPRRQPASMSVAYTQSLGLSRVDKTHTLDQTQDAFPRCLHGKKE